MLKIRIEVARPTHNYDILLEPGLATDWRREVEDRVLSDNYLALVDANLARLCGLPADGAVEGRWRYLWVEPGNANKTVEHFATLCKRVFRFRPNRETVVTGYGGGAILDMAGFLAATLLRGLRLALVPTSLVAQIENSVDGGNRLSAAGIPDLLGSYLPPELVLLDPGLLDTLPDREYVAGLAEMVKLAVLDGQEFFYQLHRGRGEILRRNHGFMAGAISRCCRVKMDLVAGDNASRAGRRLLRFGHNFGGLLERLTGYDGRVLHGEAVAVGMVLAGTIAVRRGEFSQRQLDELRELLTGFGLPVSLSQLGTGENTPIDWLDLLSGDNVKNELLLLNEHAGEQIGLVLPHEIGNCRFEPSFAAEDMVRFLRAHAGPAAIEL